MKWRNRRILIGAASLLLIIGILLMVWPRICLTGHISSQV